jgi:hypothetical protein
MIEAKLDQHRRKIDSEVWDWLRMQALKEKTTIGKIIERALKNERKRLESSNEK